jgi:DNA-binding GntR family transcriptional regulator
VVIERRDEALAALGDLLDQMLGAAAARDLPGLADLDLQFHDTLLELSGFQGLHRIWRSMDGLVRARTYATLALPGRDELIEYTAGSHRPIVEAIRSGDPDAVEQAVKHHIHEVPSLMAGRMPTADSPA